MLGFTGFSQKFSFGKQKTLFRFVDKLTIGAFLWRLTVEKGKSNKMRGTRSTYILLILKVSSFY
jgi:hypothetical protein